MIDPLGASIIAMTTNSPAAAGFVFAAGALTSVGPCVAPRYVAVAAIAGGYRRPIVPTLAFVTGLVCAFMVFGLSAGLIGSVWSCSTFLYVLLAVGLIAGGCVTLVRAVPPRCAIDGCAGGRRQEAGVAAVEPQSLGAIFLLGATSALVVSPCCTPVVAGIVATSTAIGKPMVGMLMLTTFALGHALPLFFTGAIGAFVRRFLRRPIGGQAPAIVAGALLIVLGAYYGTIA